MLTFQPPQAVTDRPPCWGKSYNQDDQGCQACMYRTSCRDEVVRLSRQPTSVFSGYGPPPPQQQYYRPPQMPVPPAPPTRQFVPPPPPPLRQPVTGVMPPPPPAQAQVPQQVPYSRIGWYGSIPDTMWGAVASVPPIFRPQMSGENFLGRLGKNIMLALTEVFFRELMLATRQAIFPPEPPRAAAVTVDVSPTKPGQVG